MSHRFIAYYRVSTQGQGASGLGLEAQRRAVADYLRATGGDLVAAFEEIESGKRNDRPALAQAIERCRLTGARLLIAKLDRLSRNAAFLLTLKDSGTSFVAADMPDATDLTIGIMAVIAQGEREAISVRTKAALGSIKARLASGEVHVSRRSGATIKRLGNPQGLSVSRPDLGAAAVVLKADTFAERVRPIAADLRGQGLSLAAVARRLDDMRVQPPRGKAWSAIAVKRVLERGAGPPP
ncbi:recombinase family protein [uncultured Phenylobacterium sp.]|uniref:recombinase family protein n=1 Tax=uncultured Phenylobacterium sp. TaxID=349273 RepID=UPI0025F41590|nr:recombinase family protein [uncultured Phenylobacterium sp.]